MIRRQWTTALEREIFLRSGTSDITIWENTFERQEHMPPSWMKTPKTVLDLGANIGITSAAYQGMWPEAEIVAVEMDPENAKLAKRNFSGAVITGAVVYVPHGGRTYDASVLPAQYTLGTGKSPVTEVPFLELLAEYFREPVDFCKMDIEGTEEEIIENALFWYPMVRHLLVECHQAVAGYTYENAVADLTEAGYKVGLISIERQAVFAWH